MMTRCWSVFALLVLFAESSRVDSDSDELDNTSIAVAGLANSTRDDCKLQDGSHQPFDVVPRDICALMQKDNCCCETETYDSSGNLKTIYRGNPAVLLGLCPAHFCAHRFSKPGGNCEGSKHAMTCYRTKRVLGVGLGCGSKSNGKATDSPDLYDRIQMYEDHEGIWRVGVDQAQIQADKEEKARQEEYDREEQKAYKAKFAVGNLISRQPPPMYGITPAAEEGIITKSCGSEGEVCTIWYYTKDWESPKAWVQISHEDMDAGFMASKLDNRERLESLGNWEGFEFDEETVAEIKKHLGK